MSGDEGVGKKIYQEHGVTKFSYRNRRKKEYIETEKRRVQEQRQECREKERRDEKQAKHEGEIKLP